MRPAVYDGVRLVGTTRSPSRRSSPAQVRAHIEGGEALVVEAGPDQTVIGVVEAQAEDRVHTHQQTRSERPGQNSKASAGKNPSARPGLESQPRSKRDRAGRGQLEIEPRIAVLVASQARHPIKADTGTFRGKRNAEHGPVADKPHVRGIGSPQGAEFERGRGALRCRSPAKDGEPGWHGGARRARPHRGDFVEGSDPQVSIGSVLESREQRNISPHAQSLEITAL